MRPWRCCWAHLAATRSRRTGGSWRPSERPKPCRRSCRRPTGSRCQKALGRFPVAVLFSGCDGPKDNLDRLSEALVTAGWGAVIVDSHGPRGIDQAEVWRLVCSGVTLPGAERAGDVAVAIADVRAMDRVDAGGSRWSGPSHGGWRFWTFLRCPTGRGALGTDGMAGGGARKRPSRVVVSTVLFYPYCGVGTLVGRTGGMSIFRS